MVGERYARKRMVVDADLQARLAVNMVGWLYFYVVMFALVVNGPVLWSIFTSSEADPEYFDAIERLQYFARFAVVPLIAMVVSLAVHGVMSAHKVAGPLFRIKTVLKDVAARRWPAAPVTLRPKDYFRDVAADLTVVVQMIRDDAERARRANAETMDAARVLVAAIEAGRADPAELRAAAAATLERAERAGRDLADPDAPQAAAPAPSDAPVAEPAAA